MLGIRITKCFKLQGCVNWLLNLFNQGSADFRLLAIWWVKTGFQNAGRFSAFTRNKKLILTIEFKLNKKKERPQVRSRLICENFLPVKMNIVTAFYFLRTTFTYHWSLETFSMSDLGIFVKRFSNFALSIYLLTKMLPQFESTKVSKRHFYQLKSKKEMQFVKAFCLTKSGHDHDCLQSQFIFPVDFAISRVFS